MTITINHLTIGNDAEIDPEAGNDDGDVLSLTATVLKDEGAG